MANEHLAEYYELMQKAKKMDRINEDKALEIYLEIHEKHLPNIAMIYERPATILEKHKRYQEAIDLCEKAIQMIDDDKLTASKDKFETRIERLNEKLNKMPKDNTTPKKKTNNRSSRSWIRNLLIVGGVILLTVALLWFFMPRERPLEDLYIDVSQIIDEDAMAGLGKMNNDVAPEDLPYPITESMKSNIAKIMKNEQGVIQALCIDQGTTLGFGIMVDNGTSKREAEKFAQLMAKEFGNLAAAEYSDLKGAILMSYGDIYNHYDIVATVFTKDDTTLSKGSMNKGTGKFIFRKD